MYLFGIIFICLIQKYVFQEDKSVTPGPILNYGFLAFLYSSRNDSVKCIGIIVSERWILNYCEHGEYKYDKVRIGAQDTYDLEKRVIHPQYQKESFPQIDDNYDLAFLYATKNALFLDRTTEDIRMNSTINVWPLNLVKENETLPQTAYAHFFSISDLRFPAEIVNFTYKELPIANNTYCDEQFQKYNLALQTRPIQFCVNTSSITYKECCDNHALLEQERKLIGIMAWSTACWAFPKQSEPWVFSSIGWHSAWILEEISGDPLFGSKSQKLVNEEFPTRKVETYHNCL